MRETGEENRETIENIVAPEGSWWISKSHITGEKPPNLMKGTGEENRTRDQSMKNLPAWWGGDWRGKPKDHKCKYCRWKNLPTWTEDKERKTEIDRERLRLMERRGICSKKDLDDKGLGQNKVLYSSFRSRTASKQTATTGFPTLSAPGRQISGYSPAFGSKTILTWTLLCCLFFVASLWRIF